MSDNTRELVGLVKRNLEARHGREWRRMISAEVQRALVGHEVLMLVLSWRGSNQIPLADIQALAQASFKALDKEGP